MRGKLNRDGKTYKTGDKVELPQNVADRIQGGTLTPVAPVATKTKGEPIQMIPPDETPPVEPTETDTRTRRKG